MDPATIYAITVTLVGIGLPPKVYVEPLPPQWTMADCIKDHEKKLAGRANTIARCVSRERPYTPDYIKTHATDTVWLVTIRPSWLKPTEGRTQLAKTKYTLDECEKKRAVHDGELGLRFYCIQSRTRPESLCFPHAGVCYSLNS